jgi:CheY-like chemotaxis protein
MRTLLGTLLRHIGVGDVREAPDGASALEMLGAWIPDVILVDQRMTPIDGREFTLMLRRSKDSPASTTPIIMVTAHSERRFVEAARDAGVDEFLVKPVSAKALLERLKIVAESRRSFVVAKSYMGPDRRRRDDSQYRGPERRGGGEEDEESWEV